VGVYGLEKFLIERLKPSSGLRQVIDGERV